MKATFVNVCQVPIGGKQPGEEFALEVSEDRKSPVQLYWRKRLSEGAVKLKPKSTPATVASEGPASEAKPKTKRT